MKRKKALSSYITNVLKAQILSTLQTQHKHADINRLFISVLGDLNAHLGLLATP